MRNQPPESPRRLLCVFLAACTVLVTGPAPAVGAADPPVAALPAADPARTAEMPPEIGLGQAVLMALTNNRALSVERLNPEIQQTFEEVERAAFDPVIAAEVAFDRARESDDNRSDDLSDVVSGSLGVSQRLPTGTRLGVSTTIERDSGGSPTTARIAGLELTQALLQGRPIAVNLVRLRQARLNTDFTAYELRGFAESLVAEVEHAYWECALSGSRLTIVEKSLSLAEHQLREVEQRIKVGSLPETEVTAAQAEIALRREALINARSGLATANLRLLRLIAPEALAGPRREFALLTEPLVPEDDLGQAEAHVAVALRMRPEVNQARLRSRSGDLELVKTRNGLLPRMDFFITLGNTGYANSFGDAITEFDGENWEASAGLRFDFPLRNREAGALHQRAQFSREQTAESLRNLEDLVRVDVESGLIEVERTREQVAATAITRRLQEEKLRVETVKFGVGRSTGLLVAQAQRDLLSSQVGEVDAVVRHLQALGNFYRVEGSLLERRGVAAPGRQPSPAP